jgi:hypothetical protein
MKQRFKVTILVNTYIDKGRPRLNVKEVQGIVVPGLIGVCLRENERFKTTKANVRVVEKRRKKMVTREQRIERSLKTGVEDRRQTNEERAGQMRNPNHKAFYSAPMSVWQPKRQ